MKNIVIIALLFTGSMAFAQGYERFIVEAGARVPLDKMEDKIDVSPEFGFWFRSRMDDRDMLDIGGSFYIPTNRREFDYTTPDSIFSVKAKGVSGMAGFRVSKVYTVGFNLSVEWLSTFGYAFFVYDDKEARYLHKIHPEDFKDSDNHSFTKAFSTFHIGQGVRLNYANVGLQANYNYTPYGLFTDYVPSNFGSHSLTVGIIYRQ